MKSKKANKTNSSVCSFLGKIYGTPICFRNYLTFTDTSLRDLCIMTLFILLTCNCSATKHTMYLPFALVSCKNEWTSTDKLPKYLPLFPFQNSRLSTAIFECLLKSLGCRVATFMTTKTIQILYQN